MQAQELKELELKEHEQHLKEDRLFLRKNWQQLKKKEQLRKKEEQLRTEKEQLRKEDRLSKQLIDQGAAEEPGTKKQRISRLTIESVLMWYVHSWLSSVPAPFGSLPPSLTQYQQTTALMSLCVHLAPRKSARPSVSLF